MIPDRLIAAALFNPTSLRSPNSWIGHLPFAAWVMQQVSPKIFVELGTHSGNSYFAFCQSVAEARLSTRCYAVDTWQGDEHACQYGEEIFASVYAHNQANYSAFSRLLRMTFDDAASYFSDESIGLLHIDGLHTYEAVRHDFATWLPKLAPGAVVMFHDTNVRERNFGVWKLWEELQAHYPNNLEFVHSHGLGVLQLNNAPEGKKLAWLQPDYPGKETLKSYFAALGARQLERFDFNELKHYADSLKKALAERDGELAMLKNAVTEYVARINRFEELAEGLTATIHQYETSRSWRLTKPLRWLTAMSHGGGLLLRRAYVKTKTEGFSSALARVAQIYRNEGLLNAVFKRANVRLIGSTKSKDLMPFRNSGYTYIEPAAPSDLNEQLERMAIKPMFSIVVPVYNTPPSLLTAAIESVKKQWYPHWELILVNDASPARETCAALEKINDNRIKVLHLQENTGISGATNAGLDAAGGDYIVFMDHDDEITPDCLYELALCINREDPDFIYSDEDKLTETGEFTEPHFKPDWSPDTMMSTMFTCHVSCVRRSVQRQVGGLRSEVDGCQDWDFVLRVAEQTSRISHIPKVLYHWRIIPGSTAADIAAKSCILESSQKVRKDALARRGLAGRVEPVAQVPGYFRVAYALRGAPLISIIIPTRDNEKILRQCMDSIFSLTGYQNFEIILLDNGSRHPATLAYFESLTQNDKVRIVRHDAPFNYSELNNIGARHAGGDLLLFLNDDTEVLQADWLERLGGYAQLPHVGAVGAKLLYADAKQVQHAGVVNLEAGPGHAMLCSDADAPGYFMRNLLEYNWLAVTGACLMVERIKFDGVDGFAESLPIAYNDVDFCMRLHAAGFYNVVVPAVRLIHYESVSRGVDHIDPEKLSRLKQELRQLYQRNPKYFQYDPFFNINFHPNGANFDIPKSTTN